MGADSRLKRLALGTSSIFLLIVGVLLGVPQMYLMAVVISLVPVVYWCLGHLLQYGLVCERSLPESCAKGERVAVLLTVHNTTIFPKFYLRLSDHLPRWIRYDGNKAGDSAVILRLQPNESATVTYYLRPRHRGEHLIGPIKATSSDLIGISNYSQMIDGTDTLIVYPQVYPVGFQLVSEGAAHGWHDQENAEARGSGSDFQGVREYRTGDDLRRINWKTTARTGHLAVTEYALGFAKNLTMILDVDQSYFDGSTEGREAAFEAAVEICASVASANLRQGSAVRLLVGSGETLSDMLYDSTGGHDLLLRTLAMLAPSAGSSILSTLTYYRSQDGRNDNVIVITGRVRQDEAIQGMLSDLTHFSGKGRPTVFWIDVQEFDRAYKPGTRIGTLERSGRSRSYSSENSRNLIVGPETSIEDLLARPNF